DLGRFLAGYPDWIRTQDALHIGTHPPGLIATEAGVLPLMGGALGAGRFVGGPAPGSGALAFRVYAAGPPPSPAQPAPLILTGALTLLCCAATVVPLYALARASLPAPAAWSAAALWPLVPSAVLFQPTADTAFPLLSTTALALAARRGWVAALLAGAVLG